MKNRNYSVATVHCEGTEQLRKIKEKCATNPFRAMVGCNGTSLAALHTPRQAGISLYQVTLF